MARESRKKYGDQDRHGWHERPRNPTRLANDRAGPEISMHPEQANEKPSVHPSTVLRANGGGPEIAHDFPFVVSPSTGYPHPGGTRGAGQACRTMNSAFPQPAYTQRPWAVLPADFERVATAIRRFAPRLRALRPTLLRFVGMTLIKVRKAVLTDSESEKYACTSGSKTTVPFCGLTSLTTLEPSRLRMVIVYPACIAL